MDLILLGPGRAGTSLCLRAVDAGFRVVGVAARDSDAASAAAQTLGSEPLAWQRDLPRADLLVVAVRDDAIADVASHYAGKAGAVGAAVHLSGLVPAEALAPLEVPVASFHPLQTLPTPEAGSARLAGSWVGITSDDDFLADRLFAFATELGLRPFDLQETAKAVYHAGAAAAANYPLAALAIAHDLFRAAGVPFEAALPLVRAVVENAFEMGPLEALTGPIARGDVSTVRAQIEAVRATSPDVAMAFEAMARATGLVSGAADVVDEALR